MSNNNKNHKAEIINNKKNNRSILVVENFKSTLLVYNSLSGWKIQKNMEGLNNNFKVEMIDIYIKLYSGNRPYAIFPTAHEIFHENWPH